MVLLILVALCSIQDLCSAMLKKVLRQIEVIRSSRSGEPNFESHEVEANELQVAVSQYLQVRGTGKVHILLYPVRLLRRCDVLSPFNVYHCFSL